MLRSAFLVVAICAPACAGEPALPFSASAFESVAKDKAVVLVSANWNRRWSCGAYENAQLRSLGFDRAGAGKSGAEAPDLVLEGGAIVGKQGYTDYAFMVEPGDYQLSSFNVKVAKSVSDVGRLAAGRANLIAEGLSKAGSFSVQAGETVYIGHFFLDCAQVPMPWRYYLEDEGDFAKYLKRVDREFPGLPIGQAKFRLFDTTTMGNPHPSSRR